MIFDSLNIAATSLKAQQKAMDVVAHNISNANTVGYSRQSADIATMPSSQIGGINFGRGVDITGVSRTIDPIINGAMLNNGSQQGYWSTLNNGLNTVENVFGSLQSTGLASSIDNFFLSWQQLANNPQDNAQKFNVRAKSESLVNNLSNMNQQLSAAQLSADSQIDSQIIQVNQSLDNIASISAQITRMESGGTGSGVGSANDLRDQRDQAVRALSVLMPVQQVDDQKGGLLLQTTSGDLLLQDATARHIARGTATPGSFSGLVIAQTGLPITNIGQNGSIGGLIELRDNKLGVYRQQIDSIAANLAFSVNQIHASGSAATAATTVVGGATVNAALALNDPTQPAAFAAQIQTGSFTIHSYDAAGTPTPVGGTAINITAGVTTMNDVVTSLNAVTGITASIDAGNHLNITAAAGSSLAFSADSSNVLAAYEVNSFFTGASSGTLGLSAAIQADPAAIHAGNVDPLTSAINNADNSAATAMMNLQNSAISADGSISASLHDRTTAVSTRYGNDTATSTLQVQYSTAEGDSLYNQRQAISGVNTDEELISMIQFQRAYEASAKVITTTNQMLSTLMGIIR